MVKKFENIQACLNINHKRILKNLIKMLREKTGEPS